MNGNGDGTGIIIGIDIGFAVIPFLEILRHKV